MSQQAHNQACNSRSRELYNQRMTAETPEAREARLARRRVTYRACRDAETPEGREAMLVAARARRDAETPEAREARLARRPRKSYSTYAGLLRGYEGEMTMLVIPQGMLVIGQGRHHIGRHTIGMLVIGSHLR